MAQRFRALNPQQLLANAADKEPQLAADLNRQQLFQKGLKANGERLKPYRSDYYARRKNRMNPAPGFGNPDAYLTGSLHRGLFVQVKGLSVVFDSTAGTAAFMLKRDGPAIFGHTQESKGEMGQAMQPHVVREIKDKTGCR